MASTARAEGSHPVPNRCGLSWREAAIAVLSQAARPLTAREIVEHVRRVGLPVVSSSRTPAQSVNRDLHVASRRPDPVVVPGPMPGQFVHRSASPGAAGAARPPRRLPPRGPRLPIEALVDAVSRAGGIRAAVRGLCDRDQERLRHAYYRAISRGWVDLYVVDEIAVRCLGVHPCLLYGAGWWDAVATPPTG